MYEFLLKSLKDKFVYVLTSSIEAKGNDILGDLRKLLTSLSKSFGGLEYFYVITDEGNGTVHLIMNKPVVISWLRNLWSVYHKDSYYVHMDKIDNDRIVNLAVYLSTQKNILDVGCSDGFLID